MALLWSTIYEPPSVGASHCEGEKGPARFTAAAPACGCVWGRLNWMHHAPNHEILSEIVRGQREFGWEEWFVTWMVPTT